MRDEQLNERTRFIDSVAERVQQAFADEESQGARLLLAVIDAYKTDVVPETQRGPTQLERLFKLKWAIRAAGVLIDEAQSESSQTLIGWTDNHAPQSELQKLYKFLADAVFGFSWAITEIEAEYPQFQEVFDAERAAYAKYGSALL